LSKFQGLLVPKGWEQVGFRLQFFLVIGSLLWGNLVVDKPESLLF